MLGVFSPYTEANQRSRALGQSFLTRKLVTVAHTGHMVLVDAPPSARLDLTRSEIRTTSRVGAVGGSGTTRHA